VETAIALPFLLALLAGGYWVCNDLFLLGATESAAHVHLLRSGRGQQDIAPGLAATILPGGKGVDVSRGSGSLQESFPSFPGLAGRAVSSVEYSLPRGDVGAFLELPPHRRTISREATVDCWSGETPSGKKVRRIVQGILLTGAVR